MKVESGKWKVESWEWIVESGKWKVESWEWIVESGKWRVGSGKWRVGSGVIMLIDCPLMDYIVTYHLTLHYTK